MRDAARRLAGKIRRIKPEGAAPVLREPHDHRHADLLGRRHEVRGAVQVEAAFAEALAVVGDVDEARVDVRSGLEPFHEARQHAVGVAHGVVVGVDDALLRAGAEVCVGAFGRPDLGVRGRVRVVARAVLAVHVVEEHRRTVGGKVREVGVELVEKDAVKAPARGAGGALRVGASYLGARTRALATALVVDPDDVRARTGEERRQSLLADDAAAVVVGAADPAQHAGKRNVGARAAGRDGRMADHAFGAKRGRGVAGVACEPPARRAGGLADDDEKDGGTAEPDGELGLRIDDALLGRIGRGVPCERGGEAVGDVDGRDEVAQRLVVSHDGRKRVHLRE